MEPSRPNQPTPDQPDQAPDASSAAAPRSSYQSRPTVYQPNRFSDIKPPTAAPKAPVQDVTPASSLPPQPAASPVTAPPNLQPAGPRPMVTSAPVPPPAVPLRPQSPQPLPPPNDSLPASQPSDQKAAVADPGGKSYLGAFLLSLLFGGLGIDRFYLGYKLRGVLKLLTVGGFGIWYLIDLILILVNHVSSKDGRPLKGYEQTRTVALVIFAVYLVLALGGGAYGAVLARNAVKQISPSKTVTVQIGPAAGQSANAPTALGESASFNDVSETITKVTPNPQTTGDGADPGTEYLEIDVLSQNNGSQETDVSSMDFRYVTASGTRLQTATTFGNDKEDPNKNVQVTGKESLVADFLKPGQSNTRYLIYQVPLKDNGKLQWVDRTNPESIFATFNLK